MVHTYAIRGLGARDLDRAVVLHATAFAALGERAWSRQDVAELLASPGVYGLLLEADGGDIGLAMCLVAADEAELLTLAIRPTHQRLGFGRQLLTAAIDHARSSGARALFLEVGADNPGAQALYGAAGFVTVGRRAAYYQR